MNDHARRQAILHGYMDTCYLREKTKDAVRREWLMDDDEIAAIGIKSVPSLVLNLILSNEISKMIGFPGGGIRETFWTGSMWMLDVPGRFCDHGIILPVMDPARRFIESLRVFRHARDQRPFMIGSSASARFRPVL